MNTRNTPRRKAAEISALSLALTCTLAAQQAAPIPNDAPSGPVPARVETQTRATSTPSSSAEGGDDPVVLSPFTVDASRNVGYQAKETLAGTRLRTEMRDLGASISVATEELLRDLNATDNASLMMYMGGAQVGGERTANVPTYGGGNSVNETDFRNASQDTRVRGLTTTDNTLDYWLSDIWWDGYNIERVDMLRGPNSILFGLGSPAGIINAGLRSAKFKNEGNVEVQYRSFNSLRYSMRYNRELLPKELGVLVAYVKDNKNYKQKPAFETGERGYAALKYSPKLLQSENNTLTIEVKGEKGRADANRPRWIPPVDRITRFFAPRSEYGLSGQALDPISVRNNRAIFGLSQGHRTIPYDPATGITDWVDRPNPNWIPGIGGTAPGPMMVYDQSGGTAHSDFWDPTIRRYNGLKADGTRDGSFDWPDRGFMTLDGYGTVAEQAMLPFYTAGVYREKVLTDPTVFDFYNNQLDGPNKRESMDFSYMTGSLNQTFAKGRLGYELSGFKQTFTEGQDGTLGDSALQVDFSTTLPDGTPNPNLGRPYVINDYRYLTNRYRSDREAFRGTVFGEYDFRDLNRESWITKTVGKHTLTGVMSQEKQYKESYSFARYGFSPEFAKWRMQERAAKGEAIPEGDWMLNLQSIHYLGGSVLGTDGRNLNIPRITAEHRPPTTAQFRTFDDTWIATNVSPSSPWVNQWGDTTTQSENPANYRGWTSMEVPIYDAWETGTYGNYVNDNANKSLSNIKSQSFVWQGKFLENSLVGMFGWRQDKAASSVKVVPKRLDALGRETGFNDLNSPTYVLPPPTRIEGESKTYSFAAHLDRLPGLKRLPFQASIYYNNSENFQPAASRTDIYNRALPPPQGKTKDVSIYLATKDSKYSLRVGKFKSSVTNVTADLLPNAWGVMFTFLRGTEAANTFHYRLKNGGKTLAYQATAEDDAKTLEDPNWDDGYTYWDKTLAETQVITNAWYDLVRGTPQGVLDAFGMTHILDGLPERGDPQQIGIGMSPSLTFTQDVVSDGYEIEFSALPIENWRLTFNATKTKAQRNNVGGAGLEDWVKFMDSHLDGTAGDIRIWGGAPYARTIREDWQFFRVNYTQAQQLQGRSQPDVREWAFNFVTNYEFRIAPLKGFNIGGAYRWEDKAALGYQYYNDSAGRPLTNVDKPYWGPTNDFVDGWIGYSRPIGKMNWRLTLNVQNVFASRKLIPLNTQPDGSIGAYRIPPPRTWQITSSLDF